MMEFFGRLFPAQEMRKLVSQLKLLQDHLGKHQDLCVHEVALQEFVRGLPGRSLSSKRTLMAIGCLVDRLELVKIKTQQDFGQVFEEFSSKNNLALFRKLFNLPKNGDIQ